MTEFIKWPDIEGLHNIHRNVKKYGDGIITRHGCGTSIWYEAKIKLDGTNAAVQLRPDGSVVAQSRSRVITPGDDNLGFAKWVAENEQYFKDIRVVADELGLKGQLVTLFGEWCGQGIQKRTAISKIDRKIFAVFAAQEEDQAGDRLHTGPGFLKELIVEWSDVFVLPWIDDFHVMCDFSDEQQLTVAAEKINALVADVEACDPWVKATFGIEGLGEGVVLYPVIDGNMTLLRDVYSDLVFKAKGEKHQVVKQKKPVQVDPEKVSSIEGFVKLFVTENRLEQIAQRVGDKDPKLTGQFLKEFGGDVQKESVAELEASGLEWKDVAKAVNEAARKWWFA